MASKTTHPGTESTAKEIEQGTPTAVTIKRKKEKVAEEPTFELNTATVRRLSKGTDTLKFVTNTLMKTQPIRTVFLPQSNYRVDMSSATLNDLETIRLNQTTPLVSYEAILKVLHSHIENTSVGPIDYDTFLRITSLYDKETLMFGLYTATYKKPIKASVKCSKQKCGARQKLTIEPNSLVLSDNNVLKARLAEIDRSVDNIDALLKNSLVATTNRVSLAGGRLYITIHLPSLADYIMVSKRFTDDQLASDTAFILALHADEVFVLDSDLYDETGEVSHVVIDDPLEKFRFFSDMGAEMSSEIERLVITEIEPYTLHYGTRPGKCAECGAELPEVTISMEDIFFRTAYDGRK